MPFTVFSPRLTGGFLGVAVALVALPTQAEAAKTPAAVQQAQAGVARVLTDRQRGAAFAVDDTGLFVTASANVARTRSVELVYGQDRFVAERVESSAPRGLTLLRTKTPTKARALTIARNDPKAGTRLWVLSVNKNDKAVVQTARLGRLNDVGSMETSGARTAAGRSGGPLVNAKGEVVGVTAPPRPGERSKALVTYRLAEVPGETPDAGTGGSSNFPAIPVAIALGLLLLLANVLLRRRQARSAPPVSPVPSNGGPVPASATPAVADGWEDMEITLKPR